MEMRIKKIYYCEFCKDKMFQKQAMEKHEQYCYKNPKNENMNLCLHCNYLTEKSFKVKKSNPLDESDSFIYLKKMPYHCTKYNQSMHNLKSEILQRPFIKKYETVLMPQDCNDYDLKYINLESKTK